jgi:hypothetical protein
MRGEIATRAEDLARVADETAALVEASSLATGAEQRLLFVAWERATADVARHNARLLRADGPLEHLMALPRYRSDG